MSLYRDREIAQRLSHTPDATPTNLMLTRSPFSKSQWNFPGVFETQAMVVDSVSWTGLISRGIQQDLDHARRLAKAVKGI